MLGGGISAFIWQWTVLCQLRGDGGMINKDSWLNLKWECCDSFPGCFTIFTRRIDLTPPPGIHLFLPFSCPSVSHQSTLCVVGLLFPVRLSLPLWTYILMSFLVLPLGVWQLVRLPGLGFLLACCLFLTALFGLFLCVRPSLCTTLTPWRTPNILHWFWTAKQRNNWQKKEQDWAVRVITVPDDFGTGSRPSAALNHPLHRGFCPIVHLTGHCFGNSIPTPVPKTHRK